MGLLGVRQVHQVVGACTVKIRQRVNMAYPNAAPPLVPAIGALGNPDDLGDFLLRQPPLLPNLRQMIINFHRHPPILLT